MTSETDIQRRIQIALSWGDARMFRNNVGAAWMGGDFSIRDGRLVSGHARYVQFGLCPGSSDLIGIHKMVITPAMIGRNIGVFTAVEVKHKKTTTNEQDSFIETIQHLGGIAGVARSVDDARRIVTEFTK